MAIVPKSPTTDFTSTTLNGSITDSITTINVNDASTIVTPCYAVIDREDNNGVATPNQREVIYISSKSSNALTVTRGVDNSTARAHNDSAKLEPLITVGFWDDFYDAYDADHNPADGTHDITKIALLSGATVQNLASKILSSPSISNPTFSGLLNTAVLSNPTIIQPTMTLLQGASVAPTVEGDIRWRTGDDTLVIGDGTNPIYNNLGIWKTWTPTSTGLTMGNAVVAGSYSQIGKNVFLRCSITLGSTSSVVSGPFLSAPVVMKDVNNFCFVGVVTDADVGAGTYQMLVTPSNATTIALYMWGSAGAYPNLTNISATVPFTWTTSDKMLFSGNYEAE